MLALQTFPDEAAFERADPRRRRSADVDLGATWREPGSNDAWKLTWLRDTGELYLCRADGHAGRCTDVMVLRVLSEDELDELLADWRTHRADEDGLAWLARRLVVRPRSAA